ncbi:MAG: thiamine-phosphate kinase [Polyangiaceae bacterium]
MATGEFDRIRRFAERHARSPREGVVRGIGDDAAVLVPRHGNQLVWTVDDQVERVHFERAWLSFEDLGWRATMAAASDVAAMGGKPWAILSSVAVPKDLPEADLFAITEGVARAAEFLGATVVGGNLTASDVVHVSTSVLGETRRALGRDGARPGDRVFVAGSLGLAAAFVRGRLAGVSGAISSATIGAYARPVARIGDGLVLAAAATSAIDVSDGLVQDVGHLAEAAGVAIELDASAIDVLVSPELARAASALGVPPRDLVLHGGEDYALVGTGPDVPRGFVAIGRVEKGRGIVLRTAEGTTPLGPFSGFDHFARRT